MPRKKKQETLDLTIYTKSGKLRKRKPKKSRNYFTDDTESAIVEYVSSTDQNLRNKIYNKSINHSFYKLAENIIHTFKFYYTELDNVEDLKHEVVTFLLQKLQLYKRERGKAYSYFGTIAKRYLINYNNSVYKKMKLKGSLEEVDEDKSVYVNIVNADNDKELISFIDKFVIYMENNIDKLFPKNVDKSIAEAVIILFKRRESLDIMNKQSFYLYIKEITKNTAPQITKVVRVFKTMYIKLKNEEYLNGDIDI